MRERDTYKVRHFLCETCHAPREALQWNYDSPPVCHGPMVEGVRGGGPTVQIITDDVPGGFVVENGFPTPQRFYSKSAHRAALAASGKRIGERGEFGY